MSFDVVFVVVRRQHKVEFRSEMYVGFIKWDEKERKGLIDFDEKNAGLLVEFYTKI